MGGEGSMANMITSLKNNNKLRNKRVWFFKRDIKLSCLNKARKRNTVLPIFSDAKRVMLLEWLRRENVKKAILLVFILTLIIVLGMMSLKYF